MYKLLLIVVSLFVLVSSCSRSKDNIAVESSREQLSCWQAKSTFKSEEYADRNYKILLSRDSIYITRNNLYKHGYKTYVKNKNLFFRDKEENEEFVVRIIDGTLTIGYAKNSLRAIVDEIVDVNFKECAEYPVK